MVTQSYANLFQHGKLCNTDFFQEFRASHNLSYILPLPRKNFWHKHYDFCLWISSTSILLRVSPYCHLACKYFCYFCLLVLGSNVNEVIRAVLNVLFFFTGRFHTHKSTKRYKPTKIKNGHKKDLRGKKSLICLFAFLCFCLGAFVPFVPLLRVESFCKNNKEFKTALITSFTLLLNSFYCKHEFF